MRSVEVVRHSSDLGRWESAVARPHPALRPYVREYVGGSEETVTALCRRELPTEIAPVIFNFGAPFRFFDTSDVTRFTEHRSFATGAFDRYVLVGSTGAYSCLQINFTILGARLFLGLPLRDLRNQVLPLDDVLGSGAARLTMQLQDAPSWAARFDLLDREIMARIASRRPPASAVVTAWRELVRHGGQRKIGELAHDVGWSHKHLVSQFSEEIGLAPKALARVLRFGRAAELLQVTERGRFADVAYACGYYDQAHFTRDFHAFAGVTPSELLASRLPNRGGFTA
jgi:AraC-like DNA-binding protein